MATVQMPPATPLLSNRSIGLRRSGSFTDVEKYFLRALLLDNTTSTQNPAASEKPQPQPLPSPLPEQHLECIGDTPNNRLPRSSITTSQTTTTATPATSSSAVSKSLDDDMLFQLPFANSQQYTNVTLTASTKFGRHEKKILGLWQAHEDGNHPVIMKRGGGHHRRKSSNVPDYGKVSPSSRWSSRNNSYYSSSFSHASNSTSLLGMESIKTDIEVRPFPPQQGDQDHQQQQPPRDDNSSWDEEDGGFIHYDAWEVLKDEYAEDFGFDFKETIDSMKATLAGDDDSLSHVFRILGTSADDQMSQPHVLSPPLMDSLLNFVPETISMENFWMKFSLLRDGCSLYTLKQYVKASPYTILAIETTKGEVFGAFTSNIWRNHPTFFGNSPAFLWRMRHNRRTPCHSLFEQAQMESEIDYYPYSGLNDLIQVCDDDRIAIGGGKLVPDYWETSFTSPFAGPGSNKRDSISSHSTIHGIDVESLERGQSYGFGICLDEDLLSGTTSPCGTFRNPCLINNMSKGEVFEVANLELWTLTPCSDVQSAEKMEMTRFFVEESLRTVSTSTTSSASNNDVYSNPFNNQEEFQRDFYRRIGHNTPTRHQRNGSFEFRHIVAPCSRR